MATNWYGANQNFRQGNYYDGAQEYNENLNPNNPNYGKSFAGIQRFNYNNLNRLPSNLTQDLGAATYAGPRIPEGIPFNPNQGDIPYAPEKTGIDTLKETIKGWTTPAIDFMKKMGGVTPEKKAFYNAVVGERGLAPNQFTTGMYGGKEYEVFNSPSGLKVGSDIIGKGPGYEKNLYSAFGSKSIEEMEQKKLDWAQKRYEKLGRKGLGTRIFNELATARPEVVGDQTRTGDNITRGQTDREKIEAYTGRGMSDYRASRPESERQFTGHGTSGMGRSRDRFAAEGGRIGYQEGELVEDEYMAEATPGGMMEENIEEVQGEPTREQLEVIALEIFRLPLEELNEEQLNIVYQAAMEQEPAEEEVQFAAQEGPGEGIASLV